jgi:hypothetical protein
MMATETLRHCQNSIYKKGPIGQIRSLAIEESEKMGIVDVSVLFLLLCHCVTPATIIWDRVKTTPSILPTECRDENDCPCSDACRVCPTGWGPDCETSTCIRGRCGTILPCSQLLSDPSSTVVPTTTSPSLQCSGSDTSQCIPNMICARCFPGYSPGCTEAVW